MQRLRLEETAGVPRVTKAIVGRHDAAIIRPGRRTTVTRGSLVRALLRISLLIVVVAAIAVQLAPETEGATSVQETLTIRSSRYNARVRFDANRRALLGSVFAIVPFGHVALARQNGLSAAEHLVAAMQDGGKIIYLRYWGDDPRAERGGQTPASFDRARALGRAMYALRIPLNEILAAPLPPARRTAEVAFGTERLRDAHELVEAEKAAGALETLRRLLRTVPGPGMNRVLVADRAPLELAAERRFPDASVPEGAMAIFVAGDSTQFLGTLTAERLIASAKARGAL